MTVALLIAGCRCAELIPTAFHGGEATAVVADCPSPVPRDAGSLLHRARASRRAASHAEMSGDQACVDRYYESAVFAYFALDAAGDPLGRDARRGRDLYNRSLADGLRTAEEYGRIDARARWLVNGPNGTMEVPVAHRGFVWSPADFHHLADPCGAKPGQSQRTPHCREGIGATQVVVRTNPNAEPRDRFLPPKSFFPATAILRPDPAIWLGTAAGTPSAGDVLELHDPYRVRDVEAGGSPVPLAADPDSAFAMAEESAGGRRITWSGFLNPTEALNNARVFLIEPYRPGKTVIVFAHGLLDNHFIFADAFADLASRPGFLERFQLAAYRYPTGNSFLRSASIYRRHLRDLARTLDPPESDPGMQNMILVGYSMGGLLSKLQITSSGDAIWATAATRPLDELVTPESTKQLLREVFYFEPLPFVRRVVYIATPHDGSAIATRIVGRIGSRVAGRPADTRALLDQILRDNPGAILPEAEALPSSIDLLARGGPLLTAMQSLPVNPAVQYHTIAGIGHGPAECSRGDLVVPLNSALMVPGAASERIVPATHFDIYRSRETIEELDRIFQQHEAEKGAITPSPD